MANNIYIKKIGGQFIVFDENKSVSHVVNETAGEILEMISLNKNITEIKEILLNKFSKVEELTINNDVEEIINSYIDLGLVYLCK